jgi:Skp family chaperone for outer membrane proteins
MMQPATSLRLLLICACLSGCESLVPVTKPAPAVVTQPSPVLDGYVDMLAALSSADPVRQSDVFYAAEQDHIQAPTTLNALRFAMALAMPGHPNSDPVKGKRLLEQVMANPERMSAGEQTISTTMLMIANEWLKMQAEMRRLNATVDDRTRAQSNSDRRLQAQAEELIKLRKALDAAQQKLDAIRDIEKSISERSTTPAGTRDSSNRDSTSQTQTPPAGR